MWLLVLLLAACANPTQPVATPNQRTDFDENPEGLTGNWAYIRLPNDRSFSQVEPLTSVGPDPDEMPADEKMRERAPEQPPPPIDLVKCQIDGDCPEPKACLRPPRGPHPYGVCGEAIDDAGKPTWRRVVRACGPGVPCPSGRCVMAYQNLGVCFR